MHVFKNPLDANRDVLAISKMFAVASPKKTTILPKGFGVKVNKFVRFRDPVNLTRISLLTLKASELSRSTSVSGALNAHSFAAWKCSQTC